MDPTSAAWGWGASRAGLTLEGWLAEWVTVIAARRVRPRTLDNYESALAKHVTPRPSGRSSSLTSGQKTSSGYLFGPGGEGPVAGDLCPHLPYRLSGAQGRGTAWLCRPQRGHAGRRTNRSPKSGSSASYSHSEAQAVLRAARSRRNAPRWTVALALGLRQSEALGLRWRDCGPHRRERSR